MRLRSTIMTFLILFIITVSTQSCKKGCKACDYGTVCNASAGYCFCPNGFEGDSCHTLSYAKYLHNYVVNDPCSNYGNGYSVNISGGNSPYNRIYFNQLFGTQVYADIYSNAGKQGVDLVIPEQNLNSALVSGTGIYQNVTGGYAKITLNLDYSSGGYDKQCTVIMNQQ